ncbi:MAG: hypothetical protein ABI779_10380 [Acidobacteriota bacterium]
MANSLFTPILNDRTRAPNFFNGRLLTGEAMTDEQRAQRVANELLAQAVGDGVAYGLEVSPAPLVNTIETPVVSVKSGVAINRRGEILLLAGDTQVRLVRPAEAIPEPDKIFRACVPVTTGTYIADAGVYVLTLSSVRAGNGLAQVSGLGDTPARCNVKYVVDAVELRLLELPVDDTTLGDVAHLRNLVAYQCFGGGDWLDFATDPFGSRGAPTTLLDSIRDSALTDCDVPLALVYWTGSGGIQFIDLWSVRRRLAPLRTAETFPAFSEARRVVAEAMVLQFDEHVTSLIGAGQLHSGIIGTTYFRYLPAAGLLPLAASGRPGANHQQFFATNTTRGPSFFGGASLNDLLRRSLDYPPIDLQSAQLIWLYFGVENMRAANAPVAGITLPRPFVAFANGNLPYLANGRFDVSLWDYSNYALVPPQI